MRCKQIQYRYNRLKESHEQTKTQIWEMLNSDGKWEKKVQKQQLPILALEKSNLLRDVLIETPETLSF